MTIWESYWAEERSRVFTIILGRAESLLPHYEHMASEIASKGARAAFEALHEEDAFDEPDCEEDDNDSLNHVAFVMTGVMPDPYKSLSLSKDMERAYETTSRAYYLGQFARDVVNCNLLNDGMLEMLASDLRHELKDVMSAVAPVLASLIDAQSAMPRETVEVINRYSVESCHSAVLAWFRRVTQAFWPFNPDYFRHPMPSQDERAGVVKEELRGIAPLNVQMPSWLRREARNSAVAINGDRLLAEGESNAEADPPFDDELLAKVREEAMAAIQFVDTPKV